MEERRLSKLCQRKATGARFPSQPEAEKGQTDHIRLYSEPKRKRLPRRQHGRHLEAMQRQPRQSGGVQGSESPILAIAARVFRRGHRSTRSGESSREAVSTRAADRLVLESASLVGQAECVLFHAESECQNHTRVYRSHL